MLIYHNGMIIFANYYAPIIGSIIGFSVFLINTTRIGGVYFRPNQNNKKKFTLSGLNHFLIAPFCYKTEKFKTMWALYDELTLRERIDYLQLNWIFTTVSCSILFSILYHGINYGAYLLI